MEDKDKRFIIKTLDFWDKLKQSEQNLILDNISLVKYKKAERIYAKDDDSCIGIFIIKSGAVRAYILSEDGREITLYRLHDGDVCVLSASCVLENITFEVFIEAIEDSELYLINSVVLAQLCDNTYAQNYSYKMAVQRFSDVMWAMQQILFLSFDKRLAGFLVDEIKRNKTNIINLTHDQIASYIGSAREVVSRMLKYFESEGIVKLSRGSIKIINEEKLIKIL